MKILNKLQTFILYYIRLCAPPVVSTFPCRGELECNDYLLWGEINETTLVAN